MESDYLNDDEWLSRYDALVKEHVRACMALDSLLGSRDYRPYIVKGHSPSCESTGCRFYHQTGHLGPNSKVIITHVGYDTPLTLTELYYYMHLVYTRFVEDGQPQEDLDEFAAGLKFFREACDIKCHEDGSPIMEDLPHD